MNDNNERANFADEMIRFTRKPPERITQDDVNRHQGVAAQPGLAAVLRIQMQAEAPQELFTDILQVMKKHGYSNYEYEGRRIFQDIGRVGSFYEIGFTK